ncbi:MAG: 16S rRNA (cytidine(1402)-2'-O)-methyltransferase [Gemmatimonas sp.]
MTDRPLAADIHGNEGPPDDEVSETVGATMQMQDAHQDAHQDAPDVVDLGAIAADELTDHERIAPGLAAQASRMLPDAAIPGALHVVSTPIGHLGDISIRALAVLHQASVIACEDTRHTRTLLSRYGIRTATIAVHEHNEAQASPAIIRRLQVGEAVALVSDAGTPLLSDPGARLVQSVVNAGLRVVPVPGASAPLAALVASGISPYPHTFVGFLARKGEERKSGLAACARSPHTTVLFEAPLRLVDTLRDLAQAAGAERMAAVAREITKRFEEIKRGTLAELTAYYQDTPPRGEIVIVLAGAALEAPTEQALETRAAALRAEGKSPRDIVSELVSLHGATRNLAYKLAHSRDS